MEMLIGLVIGAVLAVWWGSCSWFVTKLIREWRRN